LPDRQRGKLVCCARKLLHTKQLDSALSEMLTGRTDLYERLSQMWNLVLPTIVREDKLAHAMQLAALAPREWEPPSV
ncbi:hypothetical protein R3Q06_34180, partial [Rhodococcus erythropolis]|nr:hypothetical protein [Rhodococcus erythropolis]